MAKKRIYYGLRKLKTELELMRRTISIAERDLAEDEEACDELLESIYDRLFRGAEGLKDMPEADIILNNAICFDVTWIRAEQIIKGNRETLVKLHDALKAKEEEYTAELNRFNNNIKEEKNYENC